MTDHRYAVNVEGAITAAERHAPGALSFPGGTIDPGRTGDDVLETTLRREIAEELGAVIDDDLRYVESHAFVADDGEPCVDVVFLCRLRPGETPAAQSADEVAALRWLTAAEVLGDPLAPPWIKQSIALAERRRLAAAW